MNLITLLVQIFLGMLCFANITISMLILFDKTSKKLYSSEVQRYLSSVYFFLYAVFTAIIMFGVV